MLNKGDKAPEFELLDQEGQKVKLDDYKGQKLLLYFYPRANTPGCTKQSCSVSKARPKMEKMGVASLGISPDPPDRQKKFDQKYSLGFPLLSDPDHRIAKAYGAWDKKSMYGKLLSGIIRSSFLIDEEGYIIEAWYKVKPDDTVPKAMLALENTAAPPD